MKQEILRVTGPYLRPDGRKHVVVTFADGRKSTISYPKYLMEIHLGRKLLTSETVDHIDRDYTNDNFNNLRVIVRSEHARQDALRVKKVDIVCALCGIIFSRSANSVSHASKQRKAGPFCSRQCAGKYGTSIQHDKKDALPVQQEIKVPERQYFFLEKT